MNRSLTIRSNVTSRKVDFVVPESDLPSTNPGYRALMTFTDESERMTISIDQEKAEQIACWLCEAFEFTVGTFETMTKEYRAWRNF